MSVRNGATTCAKTVRNTRHKKLLKIEAFEDPGFREGLPDSHVVACQFQ